MFVISPGGDLVGYSEWPWDRLYTPLVGVFFRGRLAAHAVCDQEPQKVSLKGPPLRYWFRLKPDSELLGRLMDDDPEVLVARLEDGVVLPRAGAVEAPASREAQLTRVEALLSRGAAGKPLTLDGFPSFLMVSAKQQIDILYLDYLGRLCDPGGHQNYGAKLASGAMSLMAIRDSLLESGEWADRRVSLSERVGALITSHLWREFGVRESPGSPRRALPPFRVREFDALGAEGYVEACYELFLGRPVDPVGSAHYTHMAETVGRAAVAVELSREAAHRGIYLDVVEE